MKLFKFAAGVFLLTACLSQATHASLISSATSTFGGAAIDFEGQVEGTIISNQYAGSGVIFSQVDSGTPQIDNLPFLYGYNASSGTGVLTGSTNGGAPYPTVAGLVLSLVNSGSGIEFWLGDTSPLGQYSIKAYNSSNTLLESFIVSSGSFVGFTNLATLKWVSVDSSVSNDAFAIDDVRIKSTVSVDESSGLALIALGLLALGMRRFRK
ncbi:hypothetical protein GCM10011613_08930 [Cellvibrio zantedeschiae]|uniref:PEP-CTERM protein-sorting domain-containing protein n=2 Tax=Cellvibrio zantedeschiae TaxID=1237077 RepID=A0ABQ3AXE8_9GAMM|nr:hypothetical protein GCM10011613_08930 [Cellvibrio zantedeschiae]